MKLRTVFVAILLAAAFVSAHTSSVWHVDETPSVVSQEVRFDNDQPSHPIWFRQSEKHYTLRVVERITSHGGTNQRRAACTAASSLCGP
jgi:hypothetical protein